MDKFEARAIVKFLSLEGENPTNIHVRMKKVYNNESPSYESIKRWAREFRCGRTSIDDEDRTGRPSTSVSEDNIRAVREVILRDRRVKIDIIAEELGLSHGSVHSIIHEKLGMNKVAARWVPRMLNAFDRDTRVTSSIDIIDLYNAAPSEFESSLVTGDETWVHHYEPESKRQSLQWKRPEEPTPVKFRASKSAGKVLLTVFWDKRGVILTDYLEKGKTITGIYYADLMRKLRTAILEKRRGMVRRGIFLLHDNAPAHTSHIAQAAIRECQFNQIPHPPYSPDLAPCDFFLFPKLKENLRGKRFDDNDAVRTWVEGWFLEQGENFFLDGIRTLRHRLQKCIDIGGDYVEKV